MQDAHLTETQQSLRPIRPEHQQFEGGEHRRRGVGRTPTHKTHLCSTVCSQSAHRTTHALGSKIALSSLCAKTSVVIWCDTCLIHGYSLTRLPP